MRLGDLLLQQRLISRDQLRAALEAQRSYGGRLGSNLLRLGFLDLDTLSGMLGDQHGVNAAQRKHVDGIDKRLLALFSARAVASYKAIPLHFTETTPRRAVIACADPGTVPVEELAFAAGSRVDVWVAPEVLVQECHERFFGIMRPKSRYVEIDLTPQAGRAAPASVRPSWSAPAPASSRPRMAPRPDLGELTPPTPVTVHGPVEVPPRSLGSVPPPASAPPPASVRPPPAVPAPASVRPPASAPLPASVRSPPSVAPPSAPAAPPPASSPSVSAPPAPAPGVRLAPQADLDLPPDDGWDFDEPAAAPPPATPEPIEVASAPDAASAPEPGARLAPTPTPDAAEASRPISAPPGFLRPVLDQPQASRLIETATSKEQVGRVLVDWMRSTFGCGLVLVVKNDMAMGWQGYFPDAEDLIEAVAVPLNKPSLLSTSYELRTAFCGPPKEDGVKVNQLLWKLLRCAPPSEVIVCPVVLANRTVNFLYTHALDDEPLTDTQLRQTQVVAGDAAAAYLRLIRRDRAKPA